MIPDDLYVLGPADHNNGCVGISATTKELIFIDNAFDFWPIQCSSFSDYYRLAILHCGVRCWHFIFTNHQLPTMTCFMLKLVAPGRLKCYEEEMKRRRNEDFMLGQDGEEEENDIVESVDECMIKHTFDANFIRSS